MDFGGFVGNEALKQRLSTAVSAGKLSHSYIISGPEGSGKSTLALILAAAMECTSQGEKPCRTCPQCRKVFSHSHPDVAVVDDEGKKTVGVALSRWAKSDLYIRPNEGKKKIYIFPRAQDMNDSAQNALLKVMEEPPEYGVFLLLTTSAGSLLPTIRSRAVELTLAPVAWEEARLRLREHFPQEEESALRSAYGRSGGYLGQAERLLREGNGLDERALGLGEAFAGHDIFVLTQVLCKMEKLKRDQLIPILRQMLDILAQALQTKAGIPSRLPVVELLAKQKTARQLMCACEDLRQALASADRNVGVGHICGYLAVRLRQQS